MSSIDRNSSRLRRRGWREDELGPVNARARFVESVRSVVPHLPLHARGSLCAASVIVHLSGVEETAFLDAAELAVSLMLRQRTTGARH